MKDYYKVLGVEEEASQEEIRARWIELTKYYHPDLKGDIETAERLSDERIKEVNEAYQVLKHPSSRSEYDFLRDLKRSVLKQIAYHQDEKKSRTKKIFLYSGIVSSFVLIGAFVFLLEFPWNTTEETGKVVVSERAKPPGPYASVESGEAQKPGKTEIPVRVAKVIPPEPSKAVTPEKPKVEKKPEATKKPPEPAVKEPEKPVRVARVAPLEPSRTVTAEKPKEAPIVIPPVVERKPEAVTKPLEPAVKEPERPAGVAAAAVPSAAVTAEKAKEAIVSPPTVQKELEPVKKPSEAAVTPEKAKVEKESEPGKKLLEPSVKEPATPAIVASVAPGEPSKPATPEAAKTPSASLAPSSGAREAEVKQFFAGYTNRYNLRDIDGFISYFSTRAVQNQKDDIEKIKKVYTNFFQNNEQLKYNFTDMKIEPHKDGLEVKANYELEGVLKKGKAKKAWKGQIRWVLVREGGTLKVLSLDYKAQ
jgi:curved DNA-binding protein CbpA